MFPQVDYFYLEIIIAFFSKGHIISPALLTSVHYFFRPGEQRADKQGLFLL